MTPAARSVSLNVAVALSLLLGVTEAFPETQIGSAPSAPSAQPETVLPANREITALEAAEIVGREVEAGERREEADRAEAARLRVVRRTVVDLGDRTLVRNEVLPPVLPEAQADAAATPVPREPSAEELALSNSVTPGEPRALMLSATVVDRRVTHLRWEHGGRSHSAWSGIDFDLLRGTTGFETADADYMLFMGVGECTGAEFEAANQAMRGAGGAENVPGPVPQTAELPPGTAGYLVETAPGEKLDDAAFEGIDALHAHYARNADQLRIDRRNAERLEAARESHRAANPEPPKVEVLNFWMVPKAARAERAAR